jgi:hypothetical protein
MSTTVLKAPSSISYFSLNLSLDGTRNAANKAWNTAGSSKKAERKGRHTVELYLSAGVNVAASQTAPYSLLQCTTFDQGL